jgi:K+-transporting ATPase ATPase C chain
MFKEIRPAFTLFLAFTAILGFGYPLLVTGIAQVVFPAQANGSLIEKDGRPTGSSLIGQPFSDPKYFWGRLSATGPYPYNAAASTGSNLGPTNPALFDVVKVRVDALHIADPSQTGPIPVDLVTASGSGLDPEISPAAAEYQLHRVAQARHMDEDALRALVHAHTRGRQFGLLGEAGVNVLQLNLALDAPKP